MQAAVVAFVVIDKNNCTETTDQLLEDCASVLDYYNVPNFIYEISEIPYVDSTTTATTTTGSASAIDGEESESSSSKSRQSLGASNPKQSSSKSKSKSRHSTGSSSSGKPGAEPKPHSRDIRASVDEKKLVELAKKLYLEKNVVKPRNSIEEQIELIWRSLLGANEPLSISSNFFDLGGDSLKAGQVVNLMRKNLLVHLTVADLFTAPTIEKMASKVATLKALGTPVISSLHKSRTAEQRESQHGLRHRKGTGRERAMSAGTQSKYGSVDSKIQRENGDRRRDNGDDDDDDDSTAEAVLQDPYFSWEYAPKLSSTSFGCLFVQSLPILFIFPVRRIIIWFLIAGPWVYLMEHGWGRYYLHFRAYISL